MQLIVGDKRVNVTVRAKGAMTVIIALKGEGLLKAGLPTSLYKLWSQPAHCARSGEHGEQVLDVLARASMVGTFERAMVRAN